MAAWVNYPGLESSKSYELTKKYLPNGASGVPVSYTHLDVYKRQ